MAKMDEVIGETKASVVVADWETWLKMAEDMEDTRSKNIVGWCEALAKLTGKPVDVDQGPVEKKKGEKGEAYISPTEDDQTKV